ncbi:hypothetical protein B0I35DRAFT_263904 [Stachybotrys elegans]|uniref:Uncharacterized protein n=1 Tax=Stachybotrys elegans TaxID=80388 RepID=A0A8K0WQG4_9HYPO|nr:hypothetical protein B0I35DRAFT_263904 [Stachybotrys elegans]
MGRSATLHAALRGMDAGLPWLMSIPLPNQTSSMMTKYALLHERSPVGGAGHQREGVRIINERGAAMCTDAARLGRQCRDSPSRQRPTPFILIGHREIRFLEATDGRVAVTMAQ